MTFEIPDSVFFSEAIRPEARLIWAYLNKVNDASIPVICQELKLSDRGIQKHMRALEKAQFLKIHREPGKMNSYDLLQ